MRVQLGRIVLASAACALLCGTPDLAFENERPASPKGDASVSSNMAFYIEASGRPGIEEFYRIEVALDSDFESVVATFDNRENKAGWLLGDSFDMSGVPEKYRPSLYEGIHFRVANKLQDGTYYWRVSKATGGGDWVVLDGIEQFQVDTLPPEPIESLRVQRLTNGAIQLYWSPVSRDMGDNVERVAGYRVYRYNKLLKRYPMMTRYLVSETEDTQLTLRPPPDKEKPSPDRIVFFLVNAVDEVGNEEGRRRPTKIGEMAAAFDPPNLDQLSDPNYLRQLNQEERPR